MGERASDGDTGKYSGPSSEEVDAPVAVARKEVTRAGERQRPAFETAEETAAWGLVNHRGLQSREEAKHHRQGDGEKAGGLVAAVALGREDSTRSVEAAGSGRTMTTG